MLLQDMEWDYMLVENFGEGSTVSEIICQDFDGDGTDEILVSVVGHRMLSIFPLCSPVDSNMTHGQNADFSASSSMDTG